VISVIKKVAMLCRSCLSFWKNLIFAKDKGRFVRQHSEEVKMQALILVAIYVCCFVTYRVLKPAVKGACRIVLQADEDVIEGFSNRLVGIEAKKVTRGTTRKEVRSIGILHARREVVLRAELNGKVEEILFVEGSEVEAGQELIKFEDTYFVAEAKRLSSEYVARKAEYERVKKLYEQKAGAEKAVDDARAGMEGVRAQLDGALFQLSKTSIRAPFSGTVGILRESTTKGNIVQQYSDLATIIDNTLMKVEFRVPAKYVESIAVGQNVEITVDAYDGKIFTGVVDAIDSFVDSRSHSILVRAVIPNKNKELKHGMFANVKLITGEKGDVILIDEEVIDREGSIEFVWTVDEKGRSYRRRVMTGAKDSSGIEVVAGLKEGDIVVTTGQLKLTDGTRVKILNKSDFAENGDENANSGSSEEDSQKEDGSPKKSGDSTSDGSGKEDKEVTSLADQNPEESSSDEGGEKAESGESEGSSEVSSSTENEESAGASESDGSEKPDQSAVGE
jgi:membrane fusion protein (multidrug efflux system)